MVFSRFFRKDERPAETADDADAADDVVDDDAGDDQYVDEGEQQPEQWEETTWAERATRILPMGTSTGSKRPGALYGDADVEEPYGPTHYVRASGCMLELADGGTLIDCTMALGAVGIGYADPRVTRAALEAAGSGNVAGLPHALEIDVAERFCELVPCAEQVQFLKSGAEAVSAAVRLARAYTGRDVVVGSGYFGWHDWCSSTPGVPAQVQSLFRTVPFDDVEALERAVNEAGTRLAAIVLEPVVEEMPSKEWIARARTLADEKGAVLVFDEMKTGFRLAPGGYQDFADIKPDLAAFGKALANGFPLAAVCGRADIMAAAQRSWISSTLGGEAMALAAASVVLDLHQEGGVCERLADTGKTMRRIMQDAIQSSGIPGVTLEGLDTMWFLRFDDAAAEAHFVRAAARHGCLFKRGAYNFPSLAHDEEALLGVEAAASNAFVEVRRALEQA
jgi:glutamate-1-semialdehyde 2,1-aminomutase